MKVHETGSEGETAALGRTLGRRLGAGAVVLLEGPLGAGKTAFVRGLAEGLGCDGEDVSSPTFSLVQEYRGRVPLYHVDLYRLAPHEIDDLGLEEMGVDGVMAIEWPDRWHRRPERATRVTLETIGAERRRIKIDQ